jgi:rhamnose transport system substrate-binding protein
MATKVATGKPRTEVPVGRIGVLKIDEKGETPMGEPFEFSKDNVDQFVKVF